MKELLKHQYPCMSLHGGIDQYDRDSTINEFKKGDIRLLVATSVCARGLDVKSLILVVNYDCPNHYEDYVHRCGYVYTHLCMYVYVCVSISLPSIYLFTSYKLINIDVMLLKCLPIIVIPYLLYIFKIY